ncbi:MAG: DUF2334 domain-containing protein [Candidatus Bathyarchaeia archaeon]
MLKRLLVRVDDICYFTEVDKIVTIYKPLIKLNAQLCMAVIPMVSCSIHSRFIPLKLRGKSLLFSIEKNKELIDFICSKNFEILQHGFTHEVYDLRGRPVYEFNINDKCQIERRVKAGIKLLYKAFGKRPYFFVPPWESLSKNAYKTIMKFYKGMLINLSHHTLGRISSFIPKRLPYEILPAFLSSRIHNRNYLKYHRFLILEHKYLHYPPENGLHFFLNELRRNLSQDFLVLATHYWMINSEESIKTFHKLLNYLLRQNFVPASASDIYDIIMNT